MKIKDTHLNGIKIIEPDVFEDARGYFFEIFQKKKYEAALSNKFNFIQDNFSYSKKNVIRGLHFQKKNPQGKLIYVTLGEIYDVVVDIRLNSPTFGKTFSLFLNDKNKKQLWIPKGFAHGFCVTSKFAIFNYKCDSYYDPNDEYCIKWNDPILNINWPSNRPIISNKDKEGISFKSFFKIS